ncbi:MAG: hypothetical protein JXB48_24180 [Candidatus Latescibacteria bacterium]|nr:hypothetical protein [Candidatus Latescibacterota bacterium]
MSIRRDNNGYVITACDSANTPRPIFLLGGASQYTGDKHVNDFHNDFMYLVQPVDSIAHLMQSGGHNCVKFYLPPNGLNDADKDRLAAFIIRLYKTYKVRTCLLHFAGLYANPNGEFLLYNPTPDNLEQLKILIRSLAAWTGTLGTALACVQLGNENEYYVNGAGIVKFGGTADWDSVALTPEQYHSLMDELAGEYRRIDLKHPVFLGHGQLADRQVDIINGRLTNFDGIAINVYPNWAEGRPATKVMLAMELEQFFADQVAVAVRLDKPLIIGEFGESSFGSLGTTGQRNFAANAVAAMQKFMAGSHSEYPKQIIGAFWHEYFPEQWKNVEIHESESALCLFDPAQGYEPKPAFSALSAGYILMADSLRQIFDLNVGNDLPKVHHNGAWRENYVIRLIIDAHNRTVHEDDWITIQGRRIRKGSITVEGCYIYFRSATDLKSK